MSVKKETRDMGQGTSSMCIAFGIRDMFRLTRDRGFFTPNYEL